jgi:type I restriction enzyme, R subunit
MNQKSEAQIEKELILQLQELGYEVVSILDSASLIVNLKKQLENFNATAFSDKEFEAILNHLSKGGVYEKAKTLRDYFQLTKEDGTSFYVRFFNDKEWNENRYQVTHQITQEGSYKNRYDVTLLVNGLPLVQIELKRKGTEIKEAFNQINRYQKHSFWSNYGSKAFFLE